MRKPAKFARAALLAAVTVVAIAFVQADAKELNEINTVPVTITIRDSGFGFDDIGFRVKTADVTVVNKGSKKHALAISPAEGPNAGKIIAETRTLSPGQSAKLKLTLAPGNYRMFSPVDHDRNHGLAVAMKFQSPSYTGGSEMNRVFYDYRE
jgi:hypothetical protein